MAHSGTDSAGKSKEAIAAGGSTDRPPVAIRSVCLRIARDLRTALDRDFAPWGLRTQQAAVLLRCCRQPGMNPGQLAAAVGTDTAGISGLIDHLEKRGLVSRCPNAADRRAILVEPTAAGRALAPQLREVFQAINEVLLTGFSPPEAASLDAMLQRLLVNVEARLTETADLQPPARRLRSARARGQQNDAPNEDPPQGRKET